MKTSTLVGIDAIAAHIPKHYLDLAALAKANDIDPAKYYQGLGGHRMAVLAPGEDPVTMAAEAAHALIEQFEVHVSRIGLLIVGTESAVDGAKPIASYVHGLLDLPMQCRSFDIKHACYSGTAAFKMAAEWCAARTGSGAQALVITTDVARYGVGAPGEPTQGAGAVAFLVGENPRLFTLDPAEEAVCTEQVMDFWRPHYRLEAVVQGQVSIDSYLAMLERTYEAYEKSSGKHFWDYDFLLFHVPFPKMAYKGFRRLFERQSFGASTRVYDFDTVEEAFDKRTMPALWANREVGNIYTGALYLSLAALLERERRCIGGAQLGLFSYGSGCCAEFFSGVVPVCAAEWTDRIGLGRAFSGREELDYNQYLKFRKAHEVMGQNGSLDVQLSGARGGRYAFRGIEDHQRIYCLSIPDEKSGFAGPTRGCVAVYNEGDGAMACSNSASAHMGK